MTSDPIVASHCPHESRDQSVELERLRVEHGAVIRALQEAIRDTTRLARLFAVLNESLPLDRLLDRVLATLSELFLSDIVVLLDARTNSELCPIAAIGLPIGTEGPADLPAFGGYAQAALTSNGPIVTTQAQSDPLVDARLRELGAETLVWLPITGDDGLRRGVLFLARCRLLPFEQTDIDLLGAMAYRIGLLVERAQADMARQAMEARLRQAAKTESLGRMAAAVAHQFNNTLAVVVASLDLALEDLPQSCTARDDVMRAREATMSAAKTGELMLAYIGQDSGDRESVALGALLREAIDYSRSSLPSNIRLGFTFDEPELMARVGPSQMVQLLGHLIANACEAIGVNPGEVQVALETVSSTAIDEPHPSMASFRPNASRYACIAVTDNGCGMDATTIEQIFDPFFTTKFVGRGLGLAVVLGTVRAHDGHLSVRSVVGQGTVVRVYLPLTHPVVPTTSTVIPLPVVAATGRALALVAEDEVTLRRTTTRILNRMGYEVIATSDGVEATEKFREHAMDVRIVVLDLAMPRMDGWTALEQIRRLRPDVPVILASGYDETHARKNRPFYPALAFLHKPYKVADLRSAVERLLGESRHCASIADPID